MDLVFAVARGLGIAAGIIAVIGIIWKTGGFIRRGVSSENKNRVRNVFLLGVAVFAICAIFGLGVGSVIFGLHLFNKKWAKEDRLNTPVVQLASLGKVPEKKVSAPTPEPEVMPPKRVAQAARFLVKVREGTTVTFVRKDGRKSGAIIVMKGDRDKTVLFHPEEDSSYATIFPLRGPNDCSYETKQTNGKYVACEIIGRKKVGNEEWSVGYAPYDGK